MYALVCTRGGRFFIFETWLARLGEARLQEGQPLRIAAGWEDGAVAGSALAATCQQSLVPKLPQGQVEAFRGDLLNGARATRACGPS